MADALDRVAGVILRLSSVKEKVRVDQSGFVAQTAFGYLTLSSNGRAAVCDIEWRRKSGKVQYATEGYAFIPGKGLTVHTIQDEDEQLQEDAMIVDKDTKPVENDPAANLSFNLTLTETQRRAKDNVVLPYTQQQQGGGGQIYYEPDAGDDFDDEDPDDDLDI
ncbi:Elongator complex protein 5 [Syncephalastrum racemosum]|uniref:Elongator complex protein 5 n=1 Tax=Syncephalastrum racemosum TaxID=13706 RepID=A0A1X2HQC3_SYNRA|nr:Elongator complex protein 5 [Syncephalastrum racemosum]